MSAPVPFVATASPTVARIRERERAKAAAAAAAAATRHEQAAPDYWNQVLADATAALAGTPIASASLDRLVRILEQSGCTLSEFERDSALMQAHARAACGETDGDVRSRFADLRRQHIEKSVQDPVQDIGQVIERGRLLERLEVDEAVAIVAAESNARHCADLRKLLLDRGCPAEFFATPAGAEATA